MALSLPELVGSPDEYAIGENGSLTISAALGLLANDFSSNGSLWVVSYHAPSHGTLDVLTDGSFSYNPNLGYVGPDTFTYTISNGLVTQTVTDTIQVYHAAPVAVPDVYTVQAGQTLDVAATAGLLGNDIDFNGGTVYVNSYRAPSHGTLSVLTSGSLSYVPDPGFVGQDVVTYTLSDGIQQTIGTVTIVVTDPPPIADTDNYVMRPGQALTVDAASGLLVNDTGYTDKLYVVSYRAATHGTLSVLTSGALTYVPDPRFSGVDTATYTLSDGIRQTIGTLTVQVADDAPVAQPDHFIARANTTLDIAAGNGLLANDFDPNGNSIYALSYHMPAHGTLSVSTNGSLHYTPDTNYLGSDTFSYTISDGALQATSTATIQVLGSLFLFPGLVIANPDAYALRENGTLAVSAANGLLSNDFSSNGALSVISYTAPSHGTLDITTGGSLHYVPDIGYTGTDSFSYTVSGTSITQTATDTIQVYHAAPVGVADVYQVQAGTTLTVPAGAGLLANDIDYNTGTLYVNSYRAPSHGTLSVLTSGSLTYVPDPGFVGQDITNYTLSDGTQQVTAGLTIDVTDPQPFANTDNYVVRAGQALNVDANAGLLANDTGYTGTLYVQSYRAPAHGTLSVLTSGSLTYTPDPGFTGTDTTTYTGSDGVLQTIGTLNVQVVDDAPVAQPDYYVMGVNGTLDVSPTLGLLRNDYDANGDSLYVQSYRRPSHGTLDVLTNGSLVYTPDAGYVGTDTFSYTLSDGALQDQANGTINVICFCRGTRIRTPSGLVPVEQLNTGDTVLTWSGARRTIVWVGEGTVLAVPGRRSAATPVIIRKGAFAPNVPKRDLHVTKGHAFLFDGVLIPIEFLVNHRSILWDDRAQEVNVFHIELETHDILDAEGAPGESYRDDGNRWLFHNANAAWDLPAKPSCAPVLTGGPIVDTVWRRLLDRAGGAAPLPLSTDPDLHLLADGVRINEERCDGTRHLFFLPTVPDALRIMSRAAEPDRFGYARDPRMLGVAIRSVTVWGTAQTRRMPAAADDFLEGFHAFEHDNDFRWTVGDAAVPAALLHGLSGPVYVALDIAMTARYPASQAIAAAA